MPTDCLPKMAAASIDGLAAVKYSVRFDYDKSVVKEFSDHEIIGPGFSSVPGGDQYLNRSDQLDSILC